MLLFEDNDPIIQELNIDDAAIIEPEEIFGTESEYSIESYINLEYGRERGNKSSKFLNEPVYETLRLPHQSVAHFQMNKTRSILLAPATVSSKLNFGLQSSIYSLF